MSLLKFKNGNAWQNLQLGTDNIANGAITSAKIADGTIVAGDIANGTITANKFASGVIPTFPKITVKTGTLSKQKVSNTGNRFVINIGATMPNNNYLVEVMGDGGSEGVFEYQYLIARTTTTFTIRAHTIGAVSDTFNIHWTVVAFG